MCMLCVPGIKVCFVRQVSRCMLYVPGIKVCALCGRYQGVCFVWQVSGHVLCVTGVTVCFVWQVSRCVFCVAGIKVYLACAKMCIKMCALCGRYQQQHCQDTGWGQLYQQGATGQR